MVSVSRLAGPPHLGQVTLTNSGTRLSGEPPCWVISICSGAVPQLVVRNRNDPVFFAVNHGIGVPSSADGLRPSLSAEGDLGFAKTADHGNLLELLFRSRAGEAVEFAGVHQHAVFRNEGQALRAFRLMRRRITSTIGRPYFVANSKSRSSCRDAHDGAGAVVGEDVVGHPNGHTLAVVGLLAKRPVGTPCFSIAPRSPASRLLLLSRSSSTCAFKAASVA